MLKIADAGGIGAILRALAAHPDAKGVQFEGCAALRNLRNFIEELD